MHHTIMNTERYFSYVYVLVIWFYQMAILKIHVPVASAENCSIFSGYRQCGFDYCFDSASSSPITITSPRYPAIYPSNSNCMWMIKASYGLRIELMFESFTLQSSPVPWQCTSDYFQIEDLTGKISYCGFQGPKEGRYLSIAPQIKLVFKSDHLWNYRGFRIKISTQSVGDYTIITKGPGTITSPEFPRMYPSNSFQMWKLEAPQTHTITLDCNERFQLENDSYCQKDALYISLEPTMMLASGHCSESPSIKSPNHEMYLMFRSDQYVNLPGFKCNFAFTQDATQEPQPRTCECGTYKQPRVSSGVLANGTLPWMVGIQHYGGTVFCGASLIAPQYIVTAAHCLERFIPSEIYVVIEHYNPDDMTVNKQIPVKNFVVHEQYDTNLNDFDIGIIEIEIQPNIRENHCICLPNETLSNLVGQTGTLYGWGATKTVRAGKIWLQKADLPFFDWFKCRQIYQSNFQIAVTARMMCTSIDFGKDACGGDSGGPLVMTINERVRLVGLVAFGGSRCGHSTTPGVFTRVSSYLPWIQKHVKNLCLAP